jgi:pyruvate dehydrogenase E2 component (dihydrolipoamide acetyltransferase)
MPFTVTMPKLSPTMEEGTIVKWHKKVGDFVEAGDVLFEVATDKATVEHQALDEGWLRQILVEEGKEVIINQPLAILTVEQNESLEGYQPESVIIQPPLESVSPPSAVVQEEKKEGVAEEPQKKKTAMLQQPQFVPEPPFEHYEFEYPTERLEKRLLVSPLARKLAKERGLDLSSIKGTGPNQRIMSRDLEKAQPDSQAAFRRQAPTTLPGDYEERPLSPMRKIIGQRLQEAKSFIPHFYVTQIIDAEPLVDIREQLKNQNMKFSITDFVVKACALALRQHPVINSGFHSVNQTIIQFKTIDIALAVSVEEGLITPIIRHADYKNLGELATEIRVLAQRAREGKLEMQEYKGGSFTISNLGMYGVSEFQAIINPPQAAILAVSGIQEIPVIRHGTVVPGKIFNVTLSVDHRVIDGVAAALFLQTVKRNLENPSFLLIN